MATISQAAFCPKCHKELLASDIGFCNSCNTPLAPPDNAYFGSPDYLWHQRDAHMSEVDSTHPGGKAKVTDEGKMQEITDAWFDWARRCPMEDKVAALRDAQLILQQALHAPIPARDLQQITTLGKAIGKLATAVEEYFRVGGGIHDRKIGRVSAQPEDDGRGLETTS